MRGCRLSVAIIAKDEEHHIQPCLESIDDITDDIVVLLDDRSRDRTSAICETYGAVVHRLAWRGFAGQRNEALARCRYEWVLFIDADERLTPKLRTELASLSLAADSPIAGYRIPRYNRFFGHTMRGAGWYPDHQLRLLHRLRARYDESVHVHEVAHLDGEIATLSHHLIHINIEHVGEFWRKQTSYALAEARTLYQQGRRARWRNLVGAPIRHFIWRYIRLKGWQDGPVGLFLCLAMAWFEMMTFACLLLIQRDDTY